MNIMIDSTSIRPCPGATANAAPSPAPSPIYNPCPSSNPCPCPIPYQTSLSQIQILKFKLSKKFCEWIDNQEYNIFYSNFLTSYTNNNMLSVLNMMIINNNLRSYVTLPQANPYESKRNIVMFVNNLDFTDPNLNNFCNDISQM